MRSLAKGLLRRLGFEVTRTRPNRQFQMPVEFTARDLEIFEYVRAQNLTMVSVHRLIATINACKHAVVAQVPGDFVECGVWRGGNAIAAKLVFEQYGSDKRVYLFDTFAGMVEPTEHDKLIVTGEPAAVKHRAQQRDGYNDWCMASLEDVRACFEKSGAAMNGVQFIKGDVLQTLRDAANLPGAISVLRLDTDWYESTKAELELLYPRLASGGSLLIDDFGRWDGARKAVEEYFDHLRPSERPLLQFTDSEGRMAVKP